MPLEMSAKKADCVEMVTKIAIVNGSWPFVKGLENWAPQDWPVPIFRTTLPGMSGEETSRVVIYEENIEDFRFEHWPKEKAKDFPEDGLAGSRFMERRLERIAKQLSESK